MELKKQNLLRRMSLLISLILGIFTLTACGSDDDDEDGAGTVTAKSIVGEWNVLGRNEDTFTFTDSGEGQFSYYWSNGTNHTIDYSYEMTEDGGSFIGYGEKNYGDYSFKFMGPYIAIPILNTYHKGQKYKYILYKKENLGTGSPSDFKGKFFSPAGGTITFNGDGTGIADWDMIAIDSFTYKMEGKNYAHIYAIDSKDHLLKKYCEAIIDGKYVYIDSGSNEGVSDFYEL